MSSKFFDEEYFLKSSNDRLNGFTLGGIGTFSTFGATTCADAALATTNNKAATPSARTTSARLPRIISFLRQFLIVAIDYGGFPCGVQRFRRWLASMSILIAAPDRMHQPAGRAGERRTIAAAKLQVLQRDGQGQCNQ